MPLFFYFQRVQVFVWQDSAVTSWSMNFELLSKKIMIPLKITFFLICHFHDFIIVRLLFKLAKYELSKKVQETLGMVSKIICVLFVENFTKAEPPQIIFETIPYYVPSQFNLCQLFLRPFSQRVAQMLSHFCLFITREVDISIQMVFSRKHSSFYSLILS